MSECGYEIATSRLAISSKPNPKPKGPKPARVFFLLWPLLGCFFFVVAPPKPQSHQGASALDVSAAGL